MIYFISGRGAFQGRRSRTVRYGGVFGKENVGMSNDKKGEIPFRRKTKDSSIYANQIRVSRVLRCSRKAKPMANGLIFPYLYRNKSDGAVYVVRTDGIVR